MKTFKINFKQFRKELKKLEDNENKEICKLAWTLAKNKHKQKEKKC